MTNSNISCAISTAVWVKMYSPIWWPSIGIDENSILDD